MSIFTTSNAVLSILASQGWEMEDLNWEYSPCTPVTALLGLGGVKGEFKPRRYNIGGALFISHGLMTLDWDDDNKEGAYRLMVHSLNKDVNLHPSHVWELQETQHGYHAVLLTRCEVNTEDIPEWAASMSTDPEYIRLRKEGRFDWRVTPKYSGDWVARKMYRIGTAPTLAYAEELLGAYYRAIQWVLDTLEEEPDFLYPDMEELLLGDAPAEVYNKVVSCYDYFEEGQSYINPFTNQVGYSWRVYLTKESFEDDWWDRLII